MAVLASIMVIVVLVRSRADYDAISVDAPRNGIVPMRSPPAVPSDMRHKTVHSVYGLWDTGAIPPTLLADWRAMNPTWDVVIHDRAESDALVEKEFPWLLDLYRNALPIHRSDLLRLLFVYVYGGLYIDCDVRASRPIEAVLFESGFDPSQHDFVAFLETRLPGGFQAKSASWPIRNGVPELANRVANYVFYSAPRSDVLLGIILTVASRLQRWQTMSEEQRNGIIRGGDPDYPVLYVTGPDAFTEALFGGPSSSLLPRTLLIDLDNAKAFTNSAKGSWRS